MQCCEVQSKQSARHKWWRSASGCAGSGVLLALLPKCPLCIAAYLGLWIGAGWVIPLTHILRPLLFALLAISIASVLFRRFASRIRP